MAAMAAGASEAPVPRDPAGFFLQPGQEAVLEWSGTTGASQARILDYEGKEFTTTPLSRENGRISTSVRLPRGYYEIDLAGKTFGIVSLESFAGTRDPFFGIDAVLTWLDQRPASRLAMVKALDRCGVALARERLNWNALEPKPGEWNWKADGTRSLREIYAQAKMPVLEMFHSAGPAKNTGQFPFRTLYPQDLSRVVASWPEIYRTLQETWAGLEVWNEPEGSTYGCRLPADQYTMLVKAMRYAWDQNGITSPLGGGVFMGGDPGFFHHFCVQNGLLDAVNFISIHDYKPAAAMERLVTMHRDWLRKNGKEGMPLWITESGWAWPKGGARPPPSSDAESALQITMKGVEAKACGIARYMPFCLAFYEEGGIKSFSMLGREVTPLRSMAAYAQSIRVLAGKTYVGDLGGDFLPAKVRVFQGGGETVAVVFSEDGKNVLTGFPGTPKRIEGIDGRSVKALPDGALPMPDGLLYVWSDDLQPVSETPAMQLLRASRHPVSGPVPASPIVLQYIPNAGTVTHASTRYLAEPSETSRLAVTVRIHNLSREAKSVRLRAQYPTHEDAGGSAQPVEVPAQSTAEFSWELSPAEHWKVPDPLPLTVTATDAGGRLLDRLAIPLQMEGSVEKFADQYAKAQVLKISDLTRWSGNTNPQSSTTFSHSPASGVSAAFAFGQGDRWAYPKFSLPPDALGGMESFLIRVRLLQPGDVRMALYDKQGGIRITMDPLVPADGEWHVIRVPFAQFEPNQDARNRLHDWDPARVSEVSIGINDRSADRKNTLEISHLLLLGPEK